MTTSSSPLSGKSPSLPSGKRTRANLILASQSPRRQELLAGLGLDFTIKTRSVEEVYPTHLKGAAITDYLSQLKAEAFLEDLQPDDLIITSDTIVWCNDRALGKPRDDDEASQMLHKLSYSTHTVYTSVTFLSSEGMDTINDATQVRFRKLSEEEINYYINQFKPMDRAGAYGIQDWIGYIGIEGITGCYYNVMGLPLPKVYAYFKDKL